MATRSRVPDRHPSNNANISTGATAKQSDDEPFPLASASRLVPKIRYANAPWVWTVPTTSRSSATSKRPPDETVLIGKGVGARQGTHAGSMARRFGDFDALEAFNELHRSTFPVPTGFEPVQRGRTPPVNPYNGIRDFLAGDRWAGTFPAPGRTRTRTR